MLTLKGIDHGMISCSQKQFYETGKEQQDVPCEKRSFKNTSILMLSLPPPVQAKAASTHPTKFQSPILLSHSFKTIIHY